MSEVSRQMMMYDAQKKSMLVALLLWFFLGSLGAHRFYAGRIGTAIMQVLLTLIGGALTLAGIGFVVLGLVGLFLLPGMIRAHNVALASRLG
ncbi:TM2 domain-containing protein [Paraburkholderia kirstenboschensis]|uniref:TM2 domain-containing protein n=1 Tax=Paraburkholderia kirstenboschensis TaxID=1245436 RepID=A0ABZ0EQS3_9BURK|nr:TM2 domain-containing protein [Paraburkholderia kirstenboschensis]WOD18959.1 TM2 domain-containing protein [Paraburkholderia kirstenboschensis]